MQHYYIDNAGNKDGPHDLVTVMRRIRAEKIVPTTGIYISDAAAPVPASEVPDIALFFARSESSASAAGRSTPSVSLHDILRDGWNFTLDHSVMTVFAGGMTLLSLLLAAGLIGTFGTMIGGMLAWAFFLILHFFYMIFGLRLYRGQTVSSEFINKQLAPSIPGIFIASAVLAMMMTGGFLLLVIPGIAVAVYYVFVPFFIFDRKLRLVEAMHASRLLLRKDRKRYQTTTAMLVLMHLGCMFLILPLPLSVPIFVGALARLYEEELAL